MKKNKENRPTSKTIRSTTKNTPPNEKGLNQDNNDNNNNDSQEITHAFCICSRCHKLCLITPEFWIPSVQESPKKSNIQNTSKNYQIFLGKESNWKYDSNLSAFKQNSFLNNNFLFPCCPDCFTVLLNQIKLNNDFYAVQEDFLDSTEINSSSIKNTYMSKAESKISLLQQEYASLQEIISANKSSLSSKQSNKSTSSTAHNTQSNLRKSSFTLLTSDSDDLPEINENDIKINSSHDTKMKNENDDNNLKSKRSQSLSLKDDRMQSQSNVSFSFRSFGFYGISLCLSFRITSNRHYGCINGMRLGTMTPNKVPTREFDQALYFLSQLIKSIANLAKVETPNLIVSSGIFLYEELKKGRASTIKSKAATTDALANRGPADGLGKMKIRVKLFEKPALAEDDNDDGPIVLSKMTKAEKRELSGSADSLKPRFFSSEAVQLTANDLKTIRGIQIFRKAISIFMSIVHSVLNSPSIATHFSFPYEIEDRGQKIHGVSFDYDKQNPAVFTQAMKLLLFNLKSIQLKALEDDVDRVNDE